MTALATVFAALLIFLFGYAAGHRAAWQDVGWIAGPVAQRLREDRRWRELGR